MEIDPALINTWEQGKIIFDLGDLKSFIDRLIDKGAGGPTEGW